MPKTNVIFTKRNEGGLFDEVGNKVDISDGTNSLVINEDGSINIGSPIEITDGTNSLVVNEDGSINIENSTGATLYTFDNKLLDIMRDILTQSQLTNAYLAMILGEQITALDIDSIDGGV